MKGKQKILHYVAELMLAIVCISIIYLEDAFVAGAFAVATIYNILYVLILRKKTRESITEAISNIIMLWACFINILIVGYMIYIAVAGYTYYGLLGMAEGTTHYGVNAWLNNLSMIIFVPCAIINFIYIGVYLGVIRKKLGKNNHIEKGGK